MSYFADHLSSSGGDESKKIDATASKPADANEKKENNHAEEKPIDPAIALMKSENGSCNRADLSQSWSKKKVCLLHCLVPVR
jgi:hypothetical protein